MSGTKKSFSSADLASLPESDLPVVLEMFTSQGCSSCPPADRLAELLNQRDNIYILSCHVTYWDYIGWKDTLGLEECNKRQRQYSHVSGSSRVYTPQALINGTHDVVGSRKATLFRAIETAQNNNSVRTIDVTRNGNQLTLTLPDFGASSNHMIRFFMIKKSETTPIGRGENRNETVTYVQNVIDIRNMGTWNGQAETRILDLPNNGTADEAIVLVNQNGYGPTTAVGRYSY